MSRRDWVLIVLLYIGAAALATFGIWAWGEILGWW